VEYGKYLTDIKTCKIFCKYIYGYVQYAKEKYPGELNFYMALSHPYIIILMQINATC